MPRARMSKAKEKEYYSYVDEWKSLWKSDLDALGGYNGQSCDPTRVDPKVIQWVKDNCALMPHFVKVIKSNAASGRPGLLSKNSNCMALPIPFVQQHFRELDRVITLEDGEGGTWRVSFGAPRKQPTWSQGWDRVVRDHNLKIGDVVVFVLVRKSCFHFTLFDADGSIRTKSTVSKVNVDPALIYKEELPGCSSLSPDQDQPFVRTSETEKTPITKKRLFAMLKNDLNATPGANQEAGYEECDGSAPGDSHGRVEPYQLPIPTVKQTTEPPCQKRKLQNPKEELNLNLPAEEKMFKSGVDISPSNTIAITTSTMDLPNSEVDPYNPLQSSPVPTVPQFESFDPFAFAFKSKRRMVTAMERQRAGDLAMALAKILTEHHFLYVMTETHVYRDFHLVLPDGFAAATSLPASPTRWNFLDCAGHSLDVYSKKNACNQFALHRKFWALFALHHLLEEGDVCVFALKEKELARTVLVHIFRVVPVTLSDRTSVHSHYETHAIGGTQTCTLNN